MINITTIKVKAKQTTKNLLSFVGSIFTVYKQAKDNKENKAITKYRTPVNRFVFHSDIH